jgi:hypothetical protein
MLPSRCIGTRAIIFASWCHPNSGQNAPFGLHGRGKGTAGVSASAQPLSFLRFGQGAFNLGAPLCGLNGQSTAAASQRDIF